MNETAKRFAACFAAKKATTGDCDRIVTDRKSVKWFLHDRKLAEMHGDVLVLSDCGLPTPITKSRLQACLDACNIRICIRMREGFDTFFVDPCEGVLCCNEITLKINGDKYTVLA